MTAETKVVSDYCDHSVSRIHVVIVGNQSPEIVAMTGMKKLILSECSVFLFDQVCHPWHFIL